MIEYSFSDVKGTNRHGGTPQGKRLGFYIGLLVFGLLSMIAFIVMVVLLSLAIIPSNDSLIVVLFILSGIFLGGIPSSLITLITRLRVKKLFYRCLLNDDLKFYKAVVERVRLRGDYRIIYTEIRFKVDGNLKKLWFGNKSHSQIYDLTRSLYRKWHADILYSKDNDIAFVLKYDFDISDSTILEK